MADSVYDPILAKVYKWDNDKEWVEAGSGFIQLSPIKDSFEYLFQVIDGGSATAIEPGVNEKSNDKTCTALTAKDPDETKLNNGNDKNGENGDSSDIIEINGNVHEPVFEKRIVPGTLLVRDKKSVLLWKESEVIEYALAFKSESDMEKIESVVADIISNFSADENYYSPTEESHNALGNPQILMVTSVVSADGEEIDLTLPEPKPSNIAQVLKIMTASLVSQAAKTYLAKQIIESEYISKMFELFDSFEDLESISDLHIIYKIFKCIIALAVPNILSFLLQDGNFRSFIGVFEYDPEYPNLKPGFREYINNQNLFKQVIPFDPEIQSIIHQIFRAQYIKDVVLARILEDDAYTLLLMFIKSKQDEVLRHIFDEQKQSDISIALLTILTSEDHKSNRLDAVRFIQELAVTVKTTDLAIVFFRKCMGFVKVLGEILSEPLESTSLELKIAVAELLNLLIDFNPALFREMMVDESNESHECRNFLSQLCNAISVETDIGLLGSLFEMLKNLLNVPTVMHATALSDEPTGKVLNLFYPDLATQLVAPLTKLPATISLLSDAEREKMGLLMELLITFVKQHTYRIKYLLLRTTLVQDVTRLSKYPEKYLQSLSVRFIRTCLGMRDDFYNRFLVKNDIVYELACLYEANEFKDNMISACLNELFDFIQKAPIKLIITSLVESHREDLDRLVKLGGVKIFEKLLLRYDQYQEGIEEATAETSIHLSSTTTTTAAMSHSNWNGIDREEESYFSSNVDDNFAKSLKKISPTSYTSKQTVGLVDYDEEDEPQPEQAKEQDDISLGDVGNEDLLPSIKKPKFDSNDDEEDLTFLNHHKVLSPTASSPLKRKLKIQLTSSFPPSKQQISSKSVSENN